MPRCRRLVRMGLLVGCCLLGLAGSGQCQSLNIRMQKVLATFVSQTGNSVLGVGSWITGVKFNPTTSDFDMRLVVPGSDKAQQISRWMTSRDQLANLIRKEFGSQAPDILARTNLYPPQQLMAGVRDAADAMERFQAFNRVPNLAYNAPVSSATPMKYAEGLYGQGAQTYVQGYEKTAGKFFYNNGGTCVTGYSEVAQIGEQAGVYTTSGTANTAGQWVTHAMDELAKGRGDKVAKYLSRLEADLIKSRSLAGLPIDEAFRNQMRNLKALLEKTPGELANVADDVARVLSRAQAEAGLLTAWESAGPIRRGYLRVMLDGVQAGSKLGDALSKVFKEVGKRVSAEMLVNGIVVYMHLPGVAEAAGEGKLLGTIGQLAGAYKWINMLSPALLLELTTEILQAAEDGGYGLVASSQDAWDLMSGIYSAWGRADVDPDPRRKLTLADLVANFQYEHKLKAVVYAQALRASTRDLGEATGKADQGTADAIFARCWPIIRQAWLWQRDCLATEYLKLGSQVVHTPLLIYYTPPKPKAGKPVICEATSADRKLGERLERMRQIIRILYGKGSGVAVNYYWTPAGAAVGDRDWKRSFTFPKQGTYPVKVSLEVAPFTKHTQTEPRVMLRRTVEASVNMVVGPGDDDEICPSCGQPRGTTPNCMDCTLWTHDPTK